jgi:hypothetical protein
MNTRLLMIASSVALGIAGLVATFAPVELLHALGASAAAPVPLVVQLLGALYVGFALMNWTAKDNAIGGIYSRPISLGNSVHFAVGALALAMGGLGPGASPLLVAGFSIYTLFAARFLWLVFGSQGPRQR